MVGKKKINCSGILLGSSITFMVLGLINLYSHLNIPDLSRWNLVEVSSESNERPLPPLEFHSHDNKLENVNSSMADALKSKVLCWVLTMPQNHLTKAVAIKSTWGKRCDKLIFMSSQTNSSLPSIDLGLTESRQNLWGKTKRAFKYCHDNYIDQFDWFLKADDDTYVVIENLKYLLSSYDSNEDAIYFGSRFKKFNPQGYMSGGGGYILSKKALKLFVKDGLSDPSKCKVSNSGAEDAQMGKCLLNVKVMAGDSRDAHGHGRFFPFQPVTHLTKIDPKMWYFDYIYYPIKTGPECCSDYAVSFHYVPPRKMFEMEYLIYHLHPYGIQFKDTYPALLPPDKDSIPQRIINKL